jgi:hypothetical protein
MIEKIDYVVLARDFDGVEYEIDGTPWEPKAEVSAKIEEAWQKQVKEAEAKGAECVNNSMARVKQYSVEKGVLNLHLQPSDWRHFKGTMKYQEVENTANPLSVGGVTVTSDGYIVAGRKSKLNDIGVGQFQLAPCGYVNWEDVKKNDNGFTSAMGRELREELNLDDLGPCSPLSLTGRPGVLQPMIIAELSVPYGKEELIEAHASIEKKEIDEFAFIEADVEAIEKFLKEREKELRPHLRCGLELYRERLVGRKVADSR